MISKRPEMQQTYWDPQCRVWPQTQDQVLPLPPWANHSPVSGDMTWTLGGSDGQTSLCQSVYKEMGEDKDFDLDTERPNAVRREPLTWTSYWIPSEPLLSLQWYFWKRKNKKKHAFHAATVKAVVFEIHITSVTCSYCCTVYLACICCSRLCCILIPSWSNWSHCWAKPTVLCSVYLLSKISASSIAAPKSSIFFSWLRIARISWCLRCAHTHTHTPFNKSCKQLCDA